MVAIAVLPAIVADNSVVFAWTYAKQGNTYTERIQVQARHSRVLVPTIWPTEFANTTNMLVNRKLVTPDYALKIIEVVATLGLTVDGTPNDPRVLFDLCQSFQLTAYDAAYLELAMRLNIPLATRDQNLVKAAKRVKLFLS